MVVFGGGLTWAGSVIRRGKVQAMLIETHAHLDYPDFAPDFDAVLQRARDAGVTRIITIGTSIESSRRAVELAEKYRQYLRGDRGAPELCRGSGRRRHHAAS